MSAHQEQPASGEPLLSVARWKQAVSVYLLLLKKTSCSYATRYQWSGASWRTHVLIRQECQLNFSAHCIFLLGFVLFEEKDELLIIEVS